MSQTFFPDRIFTCWHTRQTFNEWILIMLRALSQCINNDNNWTHLHGSSVTRRRYMQFSVRQQKTMMWIESDGWRRETIFCSVVSIITRLGNDAKHLTTWHGEEFYSISGGAGDSQLVNYWRFRGAIRDSRIRWFGGPANYEIIFDFKFPPMGKTFINEKLCEIAFQPASLHASGLITHF